MTVLLCWYMFWNKTPMFNIRPPICSRILCSWHVAEWVLHMLWVMAGLAQSDRASSVYVLQALQCIPLLRPTDFGVRCVGPDFPVRDQP